MLRTLRRTAGPLGRLAGFELRIGRFFAAFNAGWYLFTIGVANLGCLYVSKWEVWVYSERIGLDWSAGGAK